MTQNRREIRMAIEANWREYLSKYGNLFSSSSLSGSSPPSVFVGSYGYPKVLVGPMVPPFMETQAYWIFQNNGLVSLLRKLLILG